MSELRFSMTGSQADVTAAADELRAVLGEGGDGSAIAQTSIAHQDVGDRRVVDPVALAGVILAVPGAVLAVVDLVDRLRKRSKAEAIIATADRLCRERQVSIALTPAAGPPRALDQMKPDDLLDMADEPTSNPPPA